MVLVATAVAAALYAESGASTQRRTAEHRGLAAALMQAAGGRVRCAVDDVCTITLSGRKAATVVVVVAAAVFRGRCWSITGVYVTPATALRKPRLDRLLRLRGCVSTP